MRIWKREKNKRVERYIKDYDNENERERKKNKMAHGRMRQWNRKKEQSNIWVTETMEIKERERKKNNSTYERTEQWQSKTKVTHGRMWQWKWN